ncbi:MAG: hypothetical protein QM636_18475 [Rhizobium sp.]
MIEINQLAAETFIPFCYPHSMRGTLRREEPTALGRDGGYSVKPFAASVHADPDLATRLRRNMPFIRQTVA